MKYEEASKELEIVLTKLESGQLTLEESVSLFEKAKDLLNICKLEFNKALGKITVIKNEIENSEEVPQE